MSADITDGILVEGEKLYREAGTDVDVNAVALCVIALALRLRHDRIDYERVRAMAFEIADW